MDRIWQWAWDRYGARYSWAVFAITYLAMLPVWLGTTFLVVALEGSDRYVAAATVTVVGLLVLVYVAILAGVGPSRVVEQWAAGRGADRAMALEATYAWARKAVVRTVGTAAVCIALLLVVAGAIAGATGSRLVQYGIVGAVFGAVASLIVMHSFVEATMRPARIAIAGETGIGDALPRSRPTFAAWSNASLLAATFSFAVLAALLAAVFQASEAPVLSVAIGGALTLSFAPLVVGASFSPSLRPVRDL